MPGRPDFSNPGTQGSGQAMAVQNRPTISNVSSTQTTSVASSTTETVDIYAPSGATYRVLNMQLKVPADATATTGTHEIGVKPFGAFDVMWGESTYAADVWFTRSHWFSADSQTMPASEDATIDAMASLGATENGALQIYYRNSTDAAQDNNREYTFMFEEVSV